MFRLRKHVRSDDSGVAIVAAMAVSFIVMMLLVVIVSMTISATTASGRERVRTEGIHSAEGAVDATMAELENSTPCGAPSFSPLTLGEGTQQTRTDVEIIYYADDFATVIPCSGGAPAGDPKYAVIRATSNPTADVVGLTPTRVLEARVSLVARGGSVKLPGIYSAKNMIMEGTPDVFSAVDDGSPDIWVDTGNFYCEPTTNRQLEIEADVVVGQGNASIQEWCWFDRNVFVGGSATYSRAYPSGTQVNYRCNNHFVCGDFTVAGNLSLASNAMNLTTAGDVTTGGSITNLYKLASDGAVIQNDPDIDAMPVRGFPSVQYVYANWQNAYGMQEKHYNDFVGLLNFKSYRQGWSTRWYNASNVAGCNFNSTYYNSTINLPSTPTVYDLRPSAGGCDIMQFHSSNTLVVNADTAFMVDGFFNDGTLNIVSGDGNRHNVWFIVPDEGIPAYTQSGNQECTSATKYSLCSTYILTTDADTPIMWYTSHQFYSNGRSNSINDMYGQVFAGSVYFKGYLDLQFETLTVPGEILWQAGDPGFDVQLLSKREVSNS